MSLGLGYGLGGLALGIGIWLLGLELGLVHNQVNYTFFLIIIIHTLTAFTYTNGTIL